MFPAFVPINLEGPVFFARLEFLNQTVKRLLLVLTGLLSLSEMNVVAQSGLSATVVWEASASTNVIAYNVYYGTRSGVYTNSITVDSNTTDAVISGLAAGTTYFFAVTAVDDFSDESDYSTEAYFTAPAAPKLITQAWSDEEGSYLEITSHQIVPRSWEIQFSRDMVDWHGFGYGYSSDVDQLIWIDPVTFPQVFFRLAIY